MRCATAPIDSIVSLTNFSKILCTVAGFAARLHCIVEAGIGAILGQMKSPTSTRFSMTPRNESAEERTTSSMRLVGTLPQFEIASKHCCSVHDPETRRVLGSPVIEPTIDQPLAERPGTQIGPYKLIEEIGEGGMGVVYVAAQKEPVRRKVALKIIKPGMDTREVIARFAAEEQALAMMDHPNIAKVFDAGTTESGRPYFVMELGERSAPHPVLRRQQLDNRAASGTLRASLSRGSACASEGYHSSGHQADQYSGDDARWFPVPKIIDFGIAKAINQQLTANTVYTGHGR